jgi:dTDP-4-amino-4,6-dideoxygalactose transaminase
MDRARRYSNHGQLVLELQQRLSELMGGAYAVTASSGTAAIVGAVLATAGRARPGRNLCLMPAHTFIGSVAAVEQCGYEPYFVDVDEETWQLSPRGLEGHPMLSATGLVLVVSAYGRVVPQKPWAEFAAASGVPVVVDGAAMIEAAVARPHDCIGPVPVALSFHATKSFSTGEGGAVVTTNEKIWLAALKAMNFGYDFDRVSKGPSINGKMSEYHAAVGLAELDGWNAKLAGFRNAATLLRKIDILAASLVTAPDLASCYALHVAASPEEGRELRRRLFAGRIGCRQWYGGGAHRHPHTASCGRDALPVSERLAEVLTGIPMSPDLDALDARLIASACASDAHVARWEVRQRAT